MKTLEVKELRQKIVDYVTSMGGMVEYGKLRDHLGIEEYAYSYQLEKALKTKKLIPVYGSGEIMPGYFLRRKPIVAYKLA